MANPRFHDFNTYLPFNGGHPGRKLQHFTGFQDVPESATPDEAEEVVEVRLDGIRWIDEGHGENVYLWTEANKADASKKFAPSYSLWFTDHIVVTEINEIVANLPDGDQATLDRFGAWLQGFSNANIEVDINRIARFAVRHGKHQLIEYMAKYWKTNLAQVDTFGRTALFYIGGKQDTINIEDVLSNLSKAAIRQQVNHRDVLGATPVHYAAAQIHSSHVEYLLFMGADPDAMTFKNECVLDTLNYEPNSIMDVQDTVRNVGENLPNRRPTWGRGRTC